jgi:hypothetical protein
MSLEGAPWQTKHSRASGRTPSPTPSTTAKPYDAAEVALLIDFSSAELVAREGTVRNAMVLITHGKYRAARAFLAKISGEDL